MMNKRWLLVTGFALASLAFAGSPAFRPVASPPTGAPWSPAEIAATAKLVQRCDPAPAKGAFKLVPEDQVSSRVKRLFDEDQNVRKTDKIDWDKAMREDRLRRQEVVQYVIKGWLVTAEDHIGAGFIFQHGPCPNSYLLAHQLAGYAIALDEGIFYRSGSPLARWLYAATWDRYLMNLNQPQRFGTQYTGRGLGADCKFELVPVDPATTDEERAVYGVPTLEEAKARAKGFKC